MLCLCWASLIPKVLRRLAAQRTGVMMRGFIRDMALPNATYTPSIYQ